MRILDTLIVGGGPAGLSAALFLGRCRRDVLVCDAGNYRNKYVNAMYGFLSRDSMDPSEFLDISRDQFNRYPNVQIKSYLVTNIERQDVFKVSFNNGDHVFAKKIILATGVKDEIPRLVGIDRFLGKSIFLCPYCDGYEFKDQPIAAYGQGNRGPCLALLLREWTSNVILCSDGPLDASVEETQRLRELHIPIIEEAIIRLEGEKGELERIIFTGGHTANVRGMFFNTPVYNNNKLALQLGCQLTAKGEIAVDEYGLSSVPGVYIAGDLSPDLKFAIVAAAEGTKAGYALNRELLKQEKLILNPH